MKKEKFFVWGFNEQRIIIQEALAKLQDDNLRRKGSAGSTYDLAQDKSDLRCVGAYWGDRVIMPIVREGETRQLRTLFGKTDSYGSRYDGGNNGSQIYHVDYIHDVPRDYWALTVSPPPTTASMLTETIYGGDFQTAAENWKKTVDVVKGGLAPVGFSEMHHYGDSSEMFVLIDDKPLGICEESDRDLAWLFLPLVQDKHMSFSDLVKAKEEVIHRSRLIIISREQLAGRDINSLGFWLWALDLTSKAKRPSR